MTRAQSLNPSPEPPVTLAGLVDAPEERAVAEAHLHLVARSPGPACLLWQDRGSVRCIAHNAAFGALLGGRSLVGEALLDSVPELKAAWGRDVGSAFAGVGGSCDPVPFGARREGGTTEHHGATWIPILVGGVPRGALGVLYDATPIMERLRRLLGSVAHDLQDPLVGIRMVAHQLRDEVPGAGAEAERIVALTLRMSRLVEELSTFARLASGEGVRLRARPLDLGAVVKSACEELESQGAAPMKVKTKSVYGLWDADAAVRLVTNLVNNARRHGPVGGLVTVRCEVVEGVAVIEVRDEGVGFDERDAPQLFEPWRRGSSREGTGLGLFIVREIVRAHGGRIVTQRRQPGGFAVRVNLPFGGSGVIKRVDARES